MKTYQFNKNINTEFGNTLNKRVRKFLKNNHTDNLANSTMVIKTLLIFGGFIITYLFILLGGIENIPLLFLLWTLLGIGQTLIGIEIMHDAVHNAYSSKKWINNLLEIPIIAIGIESAIWKIEHNFIHHNYTNIEGIDQDINPRFLFRFSKNQKKRWFHQFQHIYALFLYALLTLEWVTIKDFIKVFKYHKEGFIVTKNELILKTLVIFLKKALFFILYLGLPLYLLDFSPFLVVLMLSTMLVVSGISMTVIFQTAHVVPQCDFLQPNKEETPVSWHLHQMRTTANFATHNKFVTYLFGGLNFQIEHHLFPDVCHVYYPEISKIVKVTAEEYAIPYLENSTFTSAVKGHFSLLKKHGNN